VNEVDRAYDSAPRNIRGKKAKVNLKRTRPKAIIDASEETKTRFTQENKVVCDETNAKNKNKIEMH